MAAAPNASDFPLLSACKHHTTTSTSAMALLLMTFTGNRGWAGVAWRRRGRGRLGLEDCEA